MIIDPVLTLSIEPGRALPPTEASESRCLPVKKLELVTDLQSHLAAVRRAGRSIGFVPTMGALHEGHRSLIRAARGGCDHVVVSIFVNPTQFGPNEDFSRYPRPLEADLAACESEGVDTVFMPPVSEMYPAGAVTTVRVAKLTEGLCGAYRPGHFEGVTTVVAKLFNVVWPDVAYFGQKDYQQATVIRQMVRDLLIPIRIEVCPTVREAEGLALSSRNAYLKPQERRQAPVLFATLTWARERVLAGERNGAELVRQMWERIEAAGPCNIEYIEIVDADDLSPRPVITGRCVIALAVRIGQTRLIDNVVVDAGCGRT